MALMRGATLLRKGVIDFLKVAVPKRRLEAIAEWQIDASELPEINKWLPYEPDSLKHREGPIVGVNVGNANSFTRVDYSDTMEEHYAVNYTVRVYVWCFTPEELFERVPDEDVVRDITTKLRDDLAGLIRSTLLNQPSLGNEEAFYLQEGTFRESYSQLTATPNASGRMTASAYFEFTVKFDEHQYNEQLGYVPEEGVDLDVDLLVYEEEEE